MTEWTRIRAIFEEVVELPGAEREQRLDELCSEEPGLRTRVESLLAEDAAATPVAIEGQPAVDLVALDPTRLRRVGTYEIVRVLGAGGMGTVFEARQDRPERTVALKILRTLVASDLARRRLEFEAETLGRLSHPNIAQIHESGTWRDPDTGEESPFFAMEFVDNARPLDQYADAAQLDLRGRLTLLLTVCDAVHHGHQVGVLHRDIKPANVLVGEDGRPKVIDFGIARATDAGDEGRSLQTLTGQVLGTLGYMSPEQLDGDPKRIDVRSDVYALGATLYELLVGGTPHTKGTDSLPRFVERVRSERPRRPSTCDGARVPIPAELDWVVLRALAAEPEDRYASVSALAADLRRFLADEPLSARPPTTGYLLAKFVTRHRSLVIGGAAAFVLAVTAALIATTGWIRAARSEATAQLEAETQNAVTNYMMKLMRRARGDRDGRQARIVDMLVDSEEIVGDLAGGRPEVAAALREAAAECYITLGLADDALKVLELAIAEAQEKLPPDHRQTIKLQIKRGIALNSLERPDEAVPILEAALAVRQRQSGLRNGDVAQIQYALAKSHVLSGRFDRAEELVRNAMATYEWFAENGDGAEARDTSRRHLAQARSGLCEILAKQDRHADVLQLGEQALAALVELNGTEDPAVVRTRKVLAESLSALGDQERAIDQLQEIVGFYERKQGRGPQVLDARNSLAVALKRAGRLDEAIGQLEAVCAARAGERGQPAMIALFNLATTLADDERNADARIRYQELFVLADSAGLPASHWLRGQFHKGHGVCLHQLGELQEAERELLAGIALLETSFPDGHRRMQVTLRAIIELYRDLGRDADRARYEERLSSSR